MSDDHHVREISGYTLNGSVALNASDDSVRVAVRER